MHWPLMTAAEVHAFGIESILPYLKEEGVAIEAVNTNPAVGPQVVGKRGNSLAYIYVRTACFPSKGELSEAEFSHSLAWAESHGANAFFASVGIMCANYPDRSTVKNARDHALPIKNGGFHVSYAGMLVMTTSDRVRVLGHDQPEQS